MSLTHRYEIKMGICVLRRFLLRICFVGYHVWDSGGSLGIRIFLGEMLNICGNETLVKIFFPIGKVWNACIREFTMYVH